MKRQPDGFAQVDSKMTRQFSNLAQIQLEMQKQSRDLMYVEGKNSRELGDLAQVELEMTRQFKDLERVYSCITTNNSVPLILSEV